MCPCSLSRNSSESDPAFAGAWKARLPDRTSWNLAISSWSVGR
jgi:hypothetical protein